MELACITARIAHDWLLGLPASWCLHPADPEPSCSLKRDGWCQVAGSTSVVHRWWQPQETEVTRLPKQQIVLPPGREVKAKTSSSSFRRGNHRGRTHSTRQPSPTSLSNTGR